MRRILLVSALACLGLAQQPPLLPQAPGSTPDNRLPNGRSQPDEILKAEHKKNLEDAAAMAKLAEEVSEELEKDDRYVISLKMLKKLEDIEKLAKTVRGRLKKN